MGVQLQTSSKVSLSDTTPASSQFSASLVQSDTPSAKLACTESVSQPSVCSDPSQLLSPSTDMDQSLTMPEVSLRCLDSHLPSETRLMPLMPLETPLPPSERDSPSDLLAS